MSDWDQSLFISGGGVRTVFGRQEPGSLLNSAVVESLTILKHIQQISTRLIRAAINHCGELTGGPRCSPGSLALAKWPQVCGQVQTRPGNLVGVRVHTVVSWDNITLIEFIFTIWQRIRNLSVCE